MVFLSGDVSVFLLRTRPAMVRTRGSGEFAYVVKRPGVLGLILYFPFNTPPAMGEEGGRDIDSLRHISTISSRNRLLRREK